MLSYNLHQYFFKIRSIDTYKLSLGVKKCLFIKELILTHLFSATWAIPKKSVNDVTYFQNNVTITNRRQLTFASSNN